jgi:uncharacterized protein YbaA (DUF1428 family)
MSYVDGYVLSVPRKNKSDYIRLAEEAAAVFKDHGALSVVENWADDVPDGEITSLPMAVKCEEGEDVVFSLEKLGMQATRPRWTILDSRIGTRVTCHLMVRE